MAGTKKQPEARDTGDVDVADVYTDSVHGAAWAERQRDPARYNDPTIATPGILEDIEGDAGPHALVDPEAEELGLDPALDNRSEVQPMLDTLRDDALKRQGRELGTVEADEGPSPLERATENKEASAEAASERSDAPKSDVNP